MNSIDLEVKVIKDACVSIRESVIELDIPRYTVVTDKIADKDYTKLDDSIDEVLDMCTELEDFAEKLEQVYKSVRELGDKR